MNTDYQAFEEKIGVVFADKVILRQAFTHRSYLNENRKLDWGHNERLEFLGDAVLELIVTDFLFRAYADKDEGEMTSLRSAVVKAETLASVGVDIGLNDHLLMARGEAKDLGRARLSILANTMEAVIGAIYIDQGYDAAKDFIYRFIVPIIQKIEQEGGVQIDAKSKFQAKSQEHEGVTPNYKTEKEIGPDHNRRFVVGVYIGKEKVASGEGDSKQVAEQNAARAALITKGW